MNAQLVKLTEKIRASLWVIPGLCTLIAALLAFALISLDANNASNDNFRLPWMFEGGADSARTVLSMIAGSMITVAGTLYSITFVVLVLASQQFTPRLLRNFMRDRSNQFVLGLFVATFTYSLLVLRAVRGESEGLFVPHAAITVGIVLGLTSMALLIYFIDHLSHSVQISSMIVNVVHETVEQIDKLYPKHWDEAAHQPHNIPPDAEWVTIKANRSGYLQYVDYEELLKVAATADVVIREDYLVGDFIMQRGLLAYVTPVSAVNGQLEQAINGAIVLGNSPTLQQDIGYGFRQIVDVALKAISPAVNDPTTAINCIDQLGAILAVLGDRSIPERDCRDRRGVLRVIVRERSFADHVRLAFNQITHYGVGDPIIVLRMVKVLRQLRRAIGSAEYREVLRQQFEIIAAAAERSISDPHEREVLQEHLAEARAELAADSQGTAAGA